uniref:Uncharacterized protein n=1 Tax=Octopus bimaculoides TaxID=37653 RepID=A0A0L8H596_OCTBM
MNKSWEDECKLLINCQRAFSTQTFSIGKQEMIETTQKHEIF